MRTLIKAILSLCLLFTFTGAATAQPPADAPAWPDAAQGTPDGEPPSVETVCDGQIGAAHGLCNAYCEAMDCDSDTPQASQRACDKVRDNFTRITGQGLPCDTVCPCVAQYPNFIETLNGENGTLLACVEGLLGPNSVTLQTSSGFFPQSALLGPFGGCGDANSFPLIITPEETLVCNDLIREKAEAAGLECAPF